MSLNQIIVIPARMKGTRLPGKPLLDFLGRPMIWHVWNNCTKVHDQNKVYVATEDAAIFDYCKSESINCVITSKAQTAIERIKLFSDDIEADAYINIQGDEPLANSKDIKTILDYNLKYPNRVVFGRCKSTKNDFHNETKAKVVCDINDKLLYSSRAGIPVNNKGEFVNAHRAIWLYAFNKDALDQYYKYRTGTPLEIIEDNEIIRFLEIGIPVYCTDVVGDSWAVDTVEDVEIVKQLMRKKDGQKKHFNSR